MFSFNNHPGSKSVFGNSFFGFVPMIAFLLSTIATPARAENALLLGTGVLEKAIDFGWIYHWERAQIGLAGNYELFYNDQVVTDGYEHRIPIGTIVNREYMTLGAKLFTGYEHHIRQKVRAFINGGVGFSYNRGTDDDLTEFAAPIPPELTLFFPFEIGTMIWQNSWLKYGLSFGYRINVDVIEGDQSDVSAMSPTEFSFRLRLELF